MKSFIKKHEFNFIRKCMFDLNNTLRNCADKNIIETNRAYINEKILKLFPDSCEEAKELLNINSITDPLQIDRYLIDLEPYVYGMSAVTKSQLQKLFKKEKKLKIPEFDFKEKKTVYLGWFDESTRRLLISYNMNRKLVGMVCRLQGFNSTKTHICALCNRMGKDDEITYVSSLCKTTSKSLDAYKSTAFYVCLDSEKCNERITSTEKLEEILKDVNNI